MPLSRPVRRRTQQRKRETDRVHAGAALSKLFDIGPYHRNEVTRDQISRLQDLIDREGVPRTAEKVGVCEVTLLRVTSGFGHKLQPKTAAKVREFLSGKA